MKHIFKKLHFGSSHDPSRSNEIPSTSSPTPSTCGSDHRQSSSTPPPITSPTTPPPPPPAVDSGVRALSMAAAAAGDRTDYFSSEEEFQMQLALAISVSNSEFREDPDNDQIRAATLLSLGKHRIDSAREEEGTPESLSRRYWDYNVLDYDEKVVDGFYDIFGLSADRAGHGKMPSLSDLQTNIGDLGFEVIVINRAIDPALVELEQVAHCIAIDCPAAGVGLLVQRISDLITEHMGGPVRDANDMLARWTERSTELRTTLQTSLLPIGGIDVGLSRHRALLFKVLADYVGIPCRLVKGSHYTGVDDDAVNIIKLDKEREFLVDLMAAPGTLIPADVLSARDASLSSSNPRLSRTLTPLAANDSGVGLSSIELLNGDFRGTGNPIFENNGASDRMSEKAVSASREGFSTSTGSNSDKTMGLADHSHQFSSNNGVPFSQRKGIPEVPAGFVDAKERLSNTPHSQDTVDSSNLFAELNPFQAIGVGKSSLPYKSTENKVSDFQRRRENIASGPGRPPLPLVWKNRSACNEVPNYKQYDFVEGLFPRKNIEAKNFSAPSSSSSSSSPSSSAAPSKVCNEVPKVNASGISCISKTNHCGEIANGGVSHADEPYVSAQSSQDMHQGEDKPHGMVFQNSVADEMKKHGRNAIDRHDRRKCTHDRFMGTDMISSTPAQARPNRLDPMLDDVSELEIPWEHLVIGERIGLGSYGEVYHADWNGTEVAVKKFLDQDFSGDALAEFRSEVRIMRRLRHPNVVLFMGAVTRPPNLSIVTEFLPRGSLYRILHRPNCQIEEKRRIKMALDVAKGMNCLHTSTPTVVHRDLKSPNLLVDKNWNVKVCDFGLSRLKHNTFLSSKSTAGTPEWMAPEVLRNEQSNEKCDVYSFGVILWELATLRMPWSGMNPMQVVGAVGFQNRRLDIPKEVDPLVARIIWECWQTDPSLRPSFAQLTSALKPLQHLVIPSQTDAQSPPVPQEISVNSTP